MDEVSTYGHHKQANVQEVRVHAIETGMSRHGIDDGSNQYPIFSPLKVEPNAYANYRRKYYADYDTLTKPPNREVLSYKGSRSMPQARYQFADPRYQNFSAAVHASYENIAHLEGPPSYASSDYSTFARGGAKAKSMRYLTNRNPQNRKIRDSSTNSEATKKSRGTKKKTLWVICCLLIILIILAAIAVIVYFTVFTGKGKRGSLESFFLLHYFCSRSHCRGRYIALLNQRSHQSRLLVITDGDMWGVPIQERFLCLNTRHLAM